MGGFDFLKFRVSRRGTSVGGWSVLHSQEGRRERRGGRIFPSCSTNFLLLPEVYSRISINIRIIVPREHMYFILVCKPYGKQKVDSLTGIVLYKKYFSIKRKISKERVCLL
jgi:hypothetical protein